MRELKTSFEILDPRPMAHDEMVKLLDQPAQYNVGIEVTLPKLLPFFAEKKGINVDPQHTGGRADVCAVEEALGADLAPCREALTEGKTLLGATVRPDLDAFAAWVVLIQRLTETDFTVAEMDRIHAIAVADRLDNGPWEPQALPSATNPWPGKVGPGLAALSAFVSDRNLAVDERVAAMMQWLAYGESIAERYVDKVENERQDFIAALGDGRITWRTEDGLTVVETTFSAISHVIYAHSPVGIAFNEHFPNRDGSTYRKYTLMQHNEGYCDLRACWVELSAMEKANGLDATWGGSPVVGGSPQGVSSTLSMSEVEQVVRRNLRKS